MFGSLNGTSDFNVLIYDFDNVEWRLFTVTASSYASSIFTLTVQYNIASVNAAASFTTGFAPQRIVFVPDIYFGAQGTQGIIGQQGIQGIKGSDGTGSAITVTNNTTTNANTYYPILSDNTTSGNLTAVVVSSTKLYFNPSTGTINATVFNSLSDQALKTDINPILNPLDLINQLTGVRFNWKDNGEPSAGLIAQDVEKIMPELVNTLNGQKSLNYNGIIGLLVEAVKYLSKNSQHY